MVSDGYSCAAKQYLFVAVELQFDEDEKGVW